MLKTRLSYDELRATPELVYVELLEWISKEARNKDRE